MDNGTMVEAFKYLDYCQLAKKSLVSKRFRNVIQTHRHSLARLRVHEVGMITGLLYDQSDGIQIFGEELFAKEYDEWVIRNQYSKQVPSECQVVRKESIQIDWNVYELWASAYYDGSNEPMKTLICEGVELNHENWPLFQHFVRLLTDPFVCNYDIHLAGQNDVMNLLVETITPDRGRLQCDLLYFDHQGNLQKFINWIKDHFCCDLIQITRNTDSNHDQELLNFCLTGGRCASSMYVRSNDFSKVVHFVKKFLDLKNGDEYQLVEEIENDDDGDDEIRVVEVLKREYPTCFVKEERRHRHITYDFEFNNDEIGKKLQLTVEYWPSYNYEIRRSTRTSKTSVYTKISLQ